MNEYKIYTLSVKKIIDSFGNVQEAIIKKKNKSLVQIDLTRPFNFELMVLSTDFVGENAFLYQAIHALVEAEYGEQGKDEEFFRGRHRDIRKTGDGLLNHMVILDFSDVFGMKKNLKQEEYIKRAENLEEAGMIILDKGLEIAFEEDDTKQPHYVKFEASDKSGSMAKANKIFFVENDTVNGLAVLHDGKKCGLKTELYRRLMLDLVGSGSDEKAVKSKKNVETVVTAVKSKIYAYRGLYLTDADRIIVNGSVSRKNENGKEESVLVGPLLNSETVIVIDDSKESCDVNEYDNSFITAERLGELDEEGKPIFKLAIKKNKTNSNINSFDGEGFISSDYAKSINEQLGPKANGASSYQIRMPFCKGMLHTVDVGKIICEEWERLSSAESSKENLDLSEIEIEDVFNRRRTLSKVKIILTKSMFKSYGWFLKCCEKKSEDIGQGKDWIDPMAYYFEKFDEFDHSLYISQTDSIQISNMGKTALNYQFINPLAFNDKECRFEDLISEHLKLVKGMESDPVTTYLMTTANKRSDCDNDAESDADECELKKSRPAWAKAIKKNEYFIGDEYVNRKLKEHQMSLIQDILKGRLIVDGELRYLSGDLLALAASVIEKSKSKDKVTNDKLKEICTRFVGKKTKDGMCLRKDEFFLPASKLKLNYNKRLVFLRNPHLSRYEEVLLQPRRKDGKDDLYDSTNGRTKEDIYRHYFGHLQGIVMLGRKSTAPAALGGADFDGDLVRIIANKTVEKAVTVGINANAFGTLDQDGKVIPGVRRKLPYISIPSEPAKEGIITEKIDEITIRDTFSNQVGRISNISVRLGQIEYSGYDGKIQGIRNGANGFYVTHIRDKDSLCAEGCITVGLEIDANKTGTHPSLQNLIEKEGVRREYLEQFVNKKDVGKDYLYYLEEISKYNMFNDRYFCLDTTLPDKNGNYGFELRKHRNDKRPLKVPAKSDNADLGKTKLEDLPWECLNARYEWAPKSGEKIAVEKYKNAKSKQLFTFQDQNGKVTDIKNSIKEEVGKIINAYYEVEKEAARRYKNLRKYKNSNYIGRIHTILTEQYGSVSVCLKKGQGHPDIESILYDTYDYVESFLETYKDAILQTGQPGELEKEILLRRVIDHKWLFVETNSRRSVLKDIFKECYIEKTMDASEEDAGVDNNDVPVLSQESIDLLTNFDYGGYKLLYYIVKDIFRKTKEADDIRRLEELMISEPQPDMSGDSRESIEEREELLKDNIYVNRYRKIFHNSFIGKIDEVCWKRLLQKECQKDIRKLMKQRGLDENADLRYVYSRKTDRRFFWEVYSWDDMKDYVKEKTQQKVEEKNYAANTARGDSHAE